MGPFSAAPHHDVLTLVVQVAVLLGAARACGEVAQRLGQPSVVGELLAGILLGPSCLSGVVPAAGHWLVPHTEVQGYLLEVISLLGAMFLLLITGLETDLPLIRRHARTALGVSMGGILVTFGTGFVLGQYLPDALLAHRDQRAVFALFVATSMSISAIPVIAKVLFDLNLMRRDIGQTIIAAGMSDDTVGWILLSIVAVLAGGGSVGAADILGAIGRVVVFMVAAFTVGRWMVKRALDFVQDEVVSPYRLLTTVVVAMFVLGALAQAMGLESILGAFVTGIVFGQMPRLPDTVHDNLKGIALGIFAPVFFAVAGLKVNIVHLGEPALIGVTAVVILVATVGKIVGTYLGARLIGRRDHWTALAFGAGLNARGAMEIIIATIGLRLGILTQDMFSIIVLMAMTTSLMAPAALRWVLKHVQPEEQELKRLQQEELTQGSLIGRIRRVLVPVRLREAAGGGVRTVAAYVLQRLEPKTPLSITLLNVVTPGEKPEGTELLDRLGNLFPDKEVLKKVVEAPRAADAILDEAQKDYDLLVLGASEARSNSAVLFSPLVDYLVRVVPCTTMVIHGERRLEAWAPKRILVPTNGTLTAQRAAELGFALAASTDAEVVVLNVVPEDRTGYRPEVRERQLGGGYQIVQALCAIGESLGARTSAEVRVADEPDRVILEIAGRRQIDLIILGTDLRAGSDRLFLGPSVERILTHAPCPVIVINPS